MRPQVIKGTVHPEVMKGNGAVHDGSVDSVVWGIQTSERCKLTASIFK